MKLKLFFTLLFLFCFGRHYIFSQSSKALALNDSMESYYNIDQEKARLFGHQALAIAVAEKDLAAQALIYKSLGANCIIWDEPDSTLYYSEKAKALFQQLEDTMNIIDCQRFEISAWQQKENYEKAIEECKKLLESSYFEEKEDFYYRMMQELAIMYGTIDHYQSAITIYEEVLQYFQEQNDTSKIISSCNDMILLSGLTNYENGFEKPMQLFELAYPLTIVIKDSLYQAQLLSRVANVYLEQGNFQKAKSSLEQSLFIREAMQDQVRLSFGYQDMANIYMKEKDYDKAMEYVYRSLQIVSEDKNHSQTCYDFELMGKLFQIKNEHNQAINYFNQAIDIATEYRFGQQLLDCIQARILSLSALGKIEEANSDFYHYLDTYESLKASDQIEQDFWQDKLEQKKEQKQLALEHKNQQMSVIKTILICICIIVICWLFITNGKIKRLSKKS